MVFIISPLMSFKAYSNGDISNDYIFTFGVVPQQSAQVLAKKWLPIFNYLESETGYKFIFKTTKTIPLFEKNVLGKKYHFAYMNPYHYTVFNKKSGYQAMLKQGGKKIKGIIVVKKDSPILSLKDLHGKNIAFPAPAAFAATVIPISVMKKQNIIVNPTYVSSHESVYKNINYENFVAGGGIERTFEASDKSITNDLRVLWTSKGFTPHAIAASPEIPERVREKVVEAFLNLNETEAGRKLLNKLKFKFLERASDGDWDDVRALEIDLLNDLKKVSG